MLKHTKHRQQESYPSLFMLSPSLGLRQILPIIHIFIFLQISFGQELHYVKVGEILITGHHRTKEDIILRELDIQKGDTIEVKNLGAVIKRNKNQILNTGLFIKVEGNVTRWSNDGKIDLKFQVYEHWYFYPIPIFELADRNFNVWWVEQNRKLDRVNFGMRFYHMNLSGLKDVLKITGQWGYTRKFEIEYTLPGINKKRTLGFRSNVHLSNNRELGYKTQNNELVFHRKEKDNIFSRERYMASLIFRPQLYVHNYISLGLHRNKVDEVIGLDLNPDFLLNRQLRQRYFSLIYQLRWDRRNNQAYPTKGFIIDGWIIKEGLGVFNDRNILQTTINAGLYFEPMSFLFLGLEAKGSTHLIRKRMSYFGYQALGYEHNYLRGYEYYVVDGMDLIWSKLDFRVPMFEREIDLTGYMPLEKLKKMPFQCVLNLYTDYGYVNDPYYSEGNELTNSLLYSWGLGIDFITYYDKIFQVQFSMNHLQEKGIFLHYKLTF